MKIGENSGRNVDEISEIPQIREKFSRKFSGKLPENSERFLI